MDIRLGKFIVATARKAVEKYLNSGIKINADSLDYEELKGTVEQLKEERGVFVTITTYPDNKLRGCIGYPLPIKPLIEAVIDNAINAATEDPRFPPVSSSELNKVIFEVTVLTKPKIINCDPDEYPKHIKIGRDGLMVKYGFASGLLLPQVAVEFNWTPREFISYTCEKAGLPSTMWHSKEIEVYKFSGIVFAEEEPNGKVIRKRLIV
ncbi:TIGR00296 family protein [Candidatus Micrarchaeota archaeon]|nr:TIGR00296 family protein [Candidatus Micrarchaeota archaeon]